MSVRSRMPRFPRFGGLAAALVLAAAATPVAVASAAPNPTKCQTEVLETGVKSNNLADLVSIATSGQTIQVKGICRANLVINNKDLTFVGKATDTVPVGTIDGASTGRVISSTNNSALTLRNLALKRRELRPAGLVCW